MRNQIILSALATLVMLAAPHASAQMYPAPPPPPPPPNYGIATITNPTYYGVPFIALTSVDDATLLSQPDNPQVAQDAGIRAQQLCNYYGYGTLIDYSYGWTDAPSYVNFQPPGLSVAYVPSNLVSPYQGQFGIGYAQGFGEVRCQQMY